MVNPLLVHSFFLASSVNEEQESLAVGGQAVMDGVMMRNQDYLSIAVRRPDSSVVFVKQHWRSLFDSRILQRPWLRGFPILVETMVNGVKAMSRSAELSTQEEEQLTKTQLVLSLALAFVFAMLLFVVAPHLLTLVLGKLNLSGGVEGFSFHVWDGLIKFFIFIGYIVAISQLPDIRKVFAYHGAEHKSISAYESGIEEITPEKASGFSRLHPRCGTTFLLFVIVISILLHVIFLPLFLKIYRPDSFILKHSFVLFIKLFMIVPISSMAYEVIRYAAKLKNPLWALILQSPGLLLQRLTTREPEIEHLEVALVALKEALDSDKEHIKTVAYTQVDA